MKKSTTMTRDLERRQEAPLITPTDLKAAATKDITGAMNAILADVFALYLKTKNFPLAHKRTHFRDYHLLLDEDGDQLFAMTDPIAERSDRLATSGGRSVCRIMMPSTSSLTTCSRNYARTTRRWLPACARYTESAKITMTSPQQASSRRGLMELNGAPGFYSRRA